MTVSRHLSGLRVGGLIQLTSFVASLRCFVIIMRAFDV
jgi:hypothetical protein